MSELECITTIYEPQAGKGRYENTAGLIMAMVNMTAIFRRRIFAIDQASPELFNWLALRGDVIQLSDGKPPRMNLLLAAAGRKIRDDVFWTIEQDASVNTDTALRAEALFRQMPNTVAAMMLQAVDCNGDRTRPLEHDPRRCLGGLPGFSGVYKYDHAPFNATIWRTQAFRQIDFTRTKPHDRCDVDAGEQLIKIGWTLVVGPSGLNALHFPMSSYLPGRYGKKDKYGWRANKARWWESLSHAE